MIALANNHLLDQDKRGLRDTLETCKEVRDIHKSVNNLTLVPLAQKHIKQHCVRYILYRGMGYGTLCSTALSIGIVSARGSYAFILSKQGALHEK